MLKEDITFTNFDGDKVTETHYFHFSKAEIIELFLSGNLERVIVGMEEAVKNNDGKAIFARLRELIHMSYGQRDGSSFRKSTEISDNFVTTEAFSEFYFGLLREPEKVLAFCEQIIPMDIIKEAQARGELPADLSELKSTNIFEKNPSTPVRPQPQDRLPKQVRDIKVVDMSVTDAPLPGQEFQVLDGVESDHQVQAEKPQPVDLTPEQTDLLRAAGLL